MSITPTASHTTPKAATARKFNKMAMRVPELTQGGTKKPKDELAKEIIQELVPHIELIEMAKGEELEQIHDLLQQLKEVLDYYDDRTSVPMQWCHEIQSWTKCKRP